MMVAVAHFDGAMTAQERGVILDVMTSKFQLSGNVSEELLARGRWLAQESKDLSHFLKQLAPPIEKTCDVREKRELISMLENAALADGSMDSVSEYAILQLKRRFAA